MPIDDATTRSIIRLSPDVPPSADQQILSTSQVPLVTARPYLLEHKPFGERQELCCPCHRIDT